MLLKYHCLFLLYIQQLVLICSVSAFSHDTDVWNSMENMQWMRRMEKTCSRRSKVSSQAMARILLLIKISKNSMMSKDIWEAMCAAYNVKMIFTDLVGHSLQVGSDFF